MKEQKNIKEEPEFAPQESFESETNAPEQENNVGINENQEAELGTKLTEIEAQLAEQKDLYLRLAAEFDNYRKRTLREKTELILNGTEKSFTSILPVIDDFERALLNMDKSDDVATLKKGVELIYKKLIETLEKQGLSQINPIGQDFNTDYHEAIAMVPAPDDSQKGKVIDCTQKGYILNEKVIRHAQVAVGQ
ncbi:MAG: nucleotide exchange factor GrpE [Alloprevotella sp.]|nr:nucleotide exchange factor GrpE [Alloprevotella sp.]